MTMFSGLMSRWAMSRSCRYSTAAATCRMIPAAAAGERMRVFFSWL
jgi:hypothetical protein